MKVRRSALAFCAILVLAPEDGALGHDTHGTPPQGGMAAAETGGREVTLEVTLDPAASVPAVIVVPRGARVRLRLNGAGEGELHLHAFDIEAKARAGAPVPLDFDAMHTGRFPVEMHVEDPVLGQRAKAVLYIEVREP